MVFNLIDFLFSDHSFILSVCRSVIYSFLFSFFRNDRERNRENKKWNIIVAEKCTPGRMWPIGLSWNIKNMKSITLCIIECRFVPFVPSFNFEDYHLGGFCSLLQTLFLTFEFNLHADLIWVLDNIGFLMIFYHLHVLAKFSIYFPKNCRFDYEKILQIFFSVNPSSRETKKSFETEGKFFKHKINIW